MDQGYSNFDQPQQPQPVRSEVVSERPISYPPRQSGCLGRALLVFVSLGLLGSVAVNFLLLMALAISGGLSGGADERVQEKHYALNRLGTDKIAVISIEGTILSGEGFFKNQIDHARKEAKEGRLKGIVLRVNSPGGTIYGSDYMLHHLRKLKTETQVPVVVSMGGVAASGGYYVSMCVGDTANTIFAEPSTWTGSIGVLIPHYNLAELMNKWGIEDDHVASGPLKTMGSLARKMTPQERQIFQSLVNDGFRQFKDVIKSGRPKFRKNPEVLDRLATGQIYTADQAVSNGLVDKIGYVEDAIDRVIELAHLQKSNVKVVKYKAEPSLSELFLGKSPSHAKFDLAAILDSTTPRGYYLCTWLPALVGTKQE